MTKIKVFINPTSGDGAGKKLLAQKGDWLAIATDPQHIEQQVQKNIQPNDIVIIAGGDGTVNLVINALFKTQLYNQLKVVLLPLGTGNDLAAAYQIKMMPLPELVAGLTLSKSQTLPLWQFNQRIFTNYLSWGLDAKILSDVTRWRKYFFKNRLLTKCLYALAGFKNILFAKRYWFQHSECEEKLLALILTNISCYGGGSLIGSTKNNSEQSLCCVKIKTRRQFIQLMASRFFKRPYQNFTRVTEINIHTNSQHAELDGEIISNLNGIVQYQALLNLLSSHLS